MLLLCIHTYKCNNCNISLYILFFHIFLIHIQAFISAVYQDINFKSKEIGSLEV